jgi:AmmeMemoRadiSam system protein B
MWLLKDPLELTEHQLILPSSAAQMLSFIDGTRDPHEIQEALSKAVGEVVDISIVDNALAQFDEACLLDNEHSQKALHDRLAAYRSLPYRHPALAGDAYPAEPAELADEFASYAQDDNLDSWKPWHGRGVISPHIDYQRGGNIYAQVWRRAEAAVKDAELALIFGTDHNGSAGSVTLTQKPYGTPFGVIPTDLALINALVDTIGPELFAEELHHHKEHSVELSAVWLQYLRGDDPCPMVPILCGSFHEFILTGDHPDDDARLTTFIETLQKETDGKKVLAVASVDLAHVGPAFGDDFFMDNLRRAGIVASDRNLINAIAEGDAARFYNEIASIGDGNRICGLSSIYLMLRYLGQTSGKPIAYAHCPADQQNTSIVSICGILLD